MARIIHLKTDDPSLLAGFLYGIDYANDSAITLRKSNGLTATLEDTDCDEDEEVCYKLTERGLEGEE